jgi:hypothetical protein
MIALLILHSMATVIAWECLCAAARWLGRRHARKWMEAHDPPVEPTSPVEWEDR